MNLYSKIFDVIEENTLCYYACNKKSKLMSSCSLKICMRISKNMSFVCKYVRVSVFHIEFRIYENCLMYSIVYFV